MTLITVALFAALFSASRYLPIGGRAHDQVILELLGWNAMPLDLIWAAHLGAVGALLFFLRHEWVSVIIGVFRMLGYRRRPQTLDETLPLYLLLILAPASVIYAALRYFSYPGELFVGCLVPALLLIWAERRSRQSKRFLDWNASFSIALGLTLGLSALPGFDVVWIVLFIGFLFDFGREALYKIALFVLLPVLGIETALARIQLLENASQSSNSPLYFWGVLGVSTLCGILILYGMSTALKLRNFERLMYYRVIIALGLAIKLYVLPILGL